MLTVLLPKQAIFSEVDGAETKLTLDDGFMKAMTDVKSGRIRATGFAIAGMRVDQANSGAWISSGPLAMTSKLVAEPDGRWSVPTEFELKNLEFSFPQVPASGAIDRIAFDGMSAGPKLVEFERMRDELAAQGKG